MAYKVVKPFAYYADGIHAVELVVGDEREDFGSSTAGLLLEEYIVAVDAPVDAPVEADTSDDEQPETAALFNAPENRVEPRARRRK